MAAVSIDRRLLCALASVAALSLLAVAYVLGRASGAGAPPAPSVSGAPVEGGGAGPSAPVPPQGGVDTAFAEPRSSSAPHFAPAAVPEPEAPIVPPSVSAPELPPLPDDPERAAIAAYLDAVDAIQASGLAGSPESVANEMAVAHARGDASGLDGLVREAEEARRRLLGISPPAACAAHHRETLGSFDDALAMLRALKAATGSTDPATALADVAARATALKARAESLKVEDEALRRRGLRR